MHLLTLCTAACAPLQCTGAPAQYKHTKVYFNGPRKMLTHHALLVAMALAFLCTTAAGRTLFAAETVDTVDTAAATTAGK